MTLPDIPPSPAPDQTPTLQALVQAHRSLRTQFLAVLITLAALNFSLNVYLWKQASLARRQAMELDQTNTEYKLNTVPKMNEFVSRLQGFGKTHPDFAQILAKYPLRTTNAQPIALPPTGK
jgi:hypothetical protein